MWGINKSGIYLNDKNDFTIMDNGLVINNNVTYIIPNSTKPDKPVKICIENNSTMRTEKYKMTIKQVLLHTLRWDYKLRETLTAQQIHSEKGKVRHNNFKEVINFLDKRGVSRESIDNEVNMERERIVYSRPMGFNSDTYIKLADKVKGWDRVYEK